MSRRFPRWTLALAALCWIGAGCSILDPDDDGDALTEARALWASVKPSAYTYSIERLCFCFDRGPVRVTVMAGGAVTKVYVDSGEPVAAESEPWFPEVEGLFDILEEAYDGNAHSVEVTYDPETGIPTEFFIDYSENTIDEELGMVVRESMQPIG